MRHLIVLVFVFPVSALAQMGPPPGTWEPAPPDETEQYFNFGSNYSVAARNNWSFGGELYDHYIDYSWRGFDDEEDEEMEEIIVVAKRRVHHGWELYSFIEWNFAGQQICMTYSDGGHCVHHEVVYDPELIPIQGCQTITGGLGPLSASQAQQLNLDYVREQQAGGIVAGSLITLAGTGTGSVGSAIAGLGGIAVAISGFIGEFPFSAGDNVSWTLEVCNDGDGGIDQTMDVTIN